MKIRRFAILFVVISLAGICYILGFFSRYNYLTAHWDKWHGNICLVTYGKPYTAAYWRRVEARQMGFDIKPIGDCLMGPVDVAGAGGYNSVMNDALDEKFGKNWQKRFDEKADSLYILHADKNVSDAALRIGYVKQLKQLSDSLNPGSFFITVRHFARNDSIHPNVLVCRHQKSGGVATLAYYHIDPFSMNAYQIRY